MNPSDASTKTVQLIWKVDSAATKVSSPPPGLRKNPPFNPASPGNSPHSPNAFMSTKMELNVLETVGDSPLDAITDDNNAEKIATTKILGKTAKNLQQFLQFYHSFILDHRLPDALHLEDIILKSETAEPSEAARNLVGGSIVKFFESTMYLLGDAFFRDTHVTAFFNDGDAIASVGLAPSQDYLQEMVRHWQSLINQAQEQLLPSSKTGNTIDFLQNPVLSSLNGLNLNRDSLYSVQSSTTQQSGPRLDSAKVSVSASDLGEEEDLSFLNIGGNVSALMGITSSSAIDGQDNWLMTTSLNAALFQELLTSNSDFYQLLDLLVQIFDSASQNPVVGQSFLSKVQTLVSSLEHNPNQVYFQTDCHSIDMALLDDPIIITGIAANEEHAMKMKEDVVTFLLQQVSVGKKLMMLNNSSANTVITFDPKVQSSCGQKFQGAVGQTPFMIDFDNLTDAALLLLMDEFGSVIGRGNLFHLSVKLIRAWWAYDTNIYGGLAVKDLLSSSAFLVMIAAIFHQYANIITSPLHAFCLFLAEYSGFDPKTQVITLEGLKPMDDTESEAIENLGSKGGFINKGTINTLQHAVKLWQQFKTGSIEDLAGLSLPPTMGQFRVIHPLTGKNMVQNLSVETDEVSQLMAIFKAGALRASGLMKNCVMNDGSFGSLKILFESTILRYENNFQSLMGAPFVSSSAKEIAMEMHQSLIQCFHFSQFVVNGTLTIDALEVFAKELLASSDIPLRASDIFGEVLPRLSTSSRVSAVDSTIFSELAALLLKNNKTFKAVDNNLVDPLVVLAEQSGNGQGMGSGMKSLPAMIIEPPQGFSFQQKSGRQQQGFSHNNNMGGGGGFYHNNNKGNFGGRNNNQGMYMRNNNNGGSNNFFQGGGGGGGNQFMNNNNMMMNKQRMGYNNNNNNSFNNSNRGMGMGMNMGGGHRPNVVGIHHSGQRNPGGIPYGQLADSSFSLKDEETLRQQHNSWLDGF